MTRRTPIGLILLLLVLALGAGVRAQTEAPRAPESGTAAQERLLNLAERLRLSLTVASVAAYAPTLADLRLHAQQLVNLLEGVGGLHYVRPLQADPEGPGMMPELVALAAWYEGRPEEPTLREQVARALKNTRSYLSLARDAALSSIEQRQYERATQDILRVYAYLAAAYETPCETAAIPALWTVLRVLGLEEIDPPG